MTGFVWAPRYLKRLYTQGCTLFFSFDLASLSLFRNQSHVGYLLGSTYILRWGAHNVAGWMACSLCTSHGYALT